jgi:hypothetical protein
VSPESRRTEPTRKAQTSPLSVMSASRFVGANVPGVWRRCRSRAEVEVAGLRDL